MTAKLISIIGPPAAGKTTLAELLSKLLATEILYEDYAGNAFLPDAYAGKDQARLPAQLYYLMSRVRQLSLLAWPGEGLVISDYGYCQDRIYAENQLSEADLRLYNRLSQRFEGLVKSPELIVHLDASTQTLLERIARRGRDFEKAITADFLESIRCAYNDFEHSSSCEIICVDCDRTDIRQESAAAKLAEQIREKL